MFSPSLPSTAQPLTVCDLLRDLDDFNHKDVIVRGTWIAGHVGEVLVSPEPCDLPTIRDGWIWHDAIALGTAPKDRWTFLGKYYRLLESMPNPDDAKIVATFSGRIETRDHFKVERGHPLGFSYYVAAIWCRDVTDLTIFPYKPGEFERELQFRKHPFARRLKKEVKR